MRLIDALQQIASGERLGYRVHFEWIEGKLLRSDYFPARDEPCIETEMEAWAIAKLFADRMAGRVKNVFVCHKNHSPVEGYMDKVLLKHVYSPVGDNGYGDVDGSA